MIGKSYDLVIIGPPKGRVFATHWRPCDRRLILCPLVTHICDYDARHQPFGAKSLPDLMLTYRQLNKKNKYALFTNRHQPHIKSFALCSPYICINSLMNFALELVSHLLRIKQLKKSFVIFHVDRPSVESTFKLIYHFVINTLRPRQNGRHFQTTFWNAFSWMKMFDFR